ncbi:hypothetical protein AQJ66_29640 [Streptomyces bungoensis]|uniref:Uncharacterized protein n=1 Tax=Streptomyces bungoensis TaxID=285568 RepID=A0A101SSC6_9ACTN|nr:hypothetical protein AQJ66_29640 [Streptomyces bungoensis]
MVHALRVDGAEQAVRCGAVPGVQLLVDGVPQPGRGGGEVGAVRSVAGAVVLVASGADRAGSCLPGRCHGSASHR